MLMDLTPKLPNEIWEHIVSFLPPADRQLFRVVNQRFQSIGLRHVQRQILKEHRKGRSFHEIFLHFCLEGDLDAVEFLTPILSQPENVPPDGHLILWTEGLVEAIKGGHIPLVKKLLSFGALFNEEYILECQHSEMMKYLLQEFSFSDRILDQIRGSS